MTMGLAKEHQALEELGMKYDAQAGVYSLKSLYGHIYIIPGLKRRGGGWSGFIICDANRPRVENLSSPQEVYRRLLERYCEIN